MCISMHQTYINLVYFLTVHSVLGALLIVCGLYMVLWGKSREMRRMAQLVPSDETSPQPSGESIEVVVVSTMADHDPNKSNLGQTL